MKTFMNNKYSYLMAAAVLAGSMSFTACTNEEEVINPLEGPQSSVTLGFSVAGMGTKATQDEVNLGTTMQTIKNIVVAPMVNGAYSYPIVLPDLDPASPTNCHKNVKLLSSVNRFRVYGNLPDANAKPSEGSQFQGFTYTPASATLEGDKTVKDAVVPYNLLYYVDTEDTKGFSVATGDNWANASWTADQKAIGENNLIKIAGVKYKVGVFGLAVMESEAAKAEKIAFDTQDAADLGTNGATIGANVFAVDGILVSGQAASFNDKGEWGAADKKVYETAATATLATKKIGTAVSQSASKLTLNGANVYCVVSPTAVGATVDVNIRFKNVSDKYIKMNDGTVVAPNAYIYIPALLDASKLAGEDQNKAVFAEATTTVLNATVKSWGVGTGEPTQTTDLQLGIEVDMSWTAGLVFDQEI